MEMDLAAVSVLVEVDLGNDIDNLDAVGMKLWVGGNVQPGEVFWFHTPVLRSGGIVVRGGGLCLFSLSADGPRDCLLFRFGSHLRPCSRLAPGFGHRRGARRPGGIPSRALRLRPLDRTGSDRR